MITNSFKFTVVGGGGSEWPKIFNLAYKRDRIKRISYKSSKSGEKRPSMYKTVT